MSERNEEGSPMPGEVADNLPDLTAAEARELTDRVKVLTEGYWNKVAPMLNRLFYKRGWAALGYRDWNEYCQREYGSGQIVLPREERGAVMTALRQVGQLSTRAIAAAVGVSQSTVVNELHSTEQDQTTEQDLPREQNCSPHTESNQLATESSQPTTEEVTGLDGKVYPARPPRSHEPRQPQPQPASPPPPAEPAVTPEDLQRQREREQQRRDELASPADRQAYREELAKPPLERDQSRTNLPLPPVSAEEAMITEQLAQVQAVLALCSVLSGATTRIRHIIDHELDISALTGEQRAKIRESARLLRRQLDFLDAVHDMDEELRDFGTQ